MRNERGNIMITALFVSIFLFFLSTALIWTNRQDIALSLSMEHRMKAQSAARTAAMTAYASLRAFGEPPKAQTGTLSSGASWKTQFIELPAEGKRGPVLLIRSRGTSGPLSCYMTIHLLKTTTSKVNNDGSEPPRLLLFSSADDVKTNPILQSNFELTRQLVVDDQVDNLIAQDGPVFATTKVPAQSPLGVIDYVPIFSPTNPTVKAMGPLVLRLNPAPTSDVGLATLEYSDSTPAWKEIPAYQPSIPTPPETLKGLIELGSPEGAWSGLSLRAEEAVGKIFTWSDPNPPSLSAGFHASDDGAVEWSTIPPLAPQRGYRITGAIAAYKNSVYCFAQEYVYKSYNGAPQSDPIPPKVGTTITRWPCIRQYDLETKSWLTAWSAIDDDGSLHPGPQPDSRLLLVTSNGTFYTRTFDDPPKLLKLSGKGEAEVGPEIGTRSVFLYRDLPYTLSEDPDHPGFIPLDKGQPITLDSLPNYIPEIAGPIVVSSAPDSASPTPGNDTTLGGTEGSGEPENRTFRPARRLIFNLPPTSKVITCQEDLYTVLSLRTEDEKASFPPFSEFDPVEKFLGILARYDGERWHLLPNGLLPMLTSSDLTPPGSLMLCASYPNLPKALARYTVLAIDTRPFEFGL